MKIDTALVNATIKRLAPQLPRLRREVGDLKPKDIVSTERISRRARFATQPGAVPSQVELERILGDNDLLDLNYFARGQRAAKSVCRIIFLGPGGRERGYATGFMVTPHLLLTNHHVFGKVDDAEGAVIEFDFQLDVLGHPMPTERFRLRPRDYFFANEPLDFAFVAVDGEPILRGTALADFGWLQLNPTLGKINRGEFVSIIQHPGGDPKQVSIRENKVVEIGAKDAPTRLTYLCDTAPGSSGSPVLNDAWQVVALHHSGVPKRDKQGRWLGPDDKPAPPSPSENQVKWIANEGIRVSSLIESAERLAPRGAFLDELMATTRAQDVSPAVKDDDTPQTTSSSNAGSTVRRVDDGVQITVPVSFHVRLLGGSKNAPVISGTPDITATPSSTDSALDEAKILDPDYSTRKGYDSRFLGLSVAMPRLTTAAKADVTHLKNKPSEYVLDYYHFSLVMSRPRRLCFFTASNFSSDPAVRGDLSRKKLGTDQWGLEPRIEPTEQIQDKELYAGTPFDLGHVVRREDNYWGATEEEAVYANWDTFHYTNCTPQHSKFNQSQLKGLWGRLENHITSEMKTKGNKLNIFAGPVFSNTDKKVNGVPVPKQFWKVLVGVRDNGKLFAFGFVLSQAQLIKDIEAEFDPGEFKTFQLSLKKIESMTDVRFSASVKKADTMASASPNEKLELSNLEKLRWD
jgi:endonuclease G